MKRVFGLGILWIFMFIFFIATSAVHYHINEQLTIASSMYPDVELQMISFFGFIARIFQIIFAVGFVVISGGILWALATPTTQQQPPSYGGFQGVGPYG